MRYLKELICEQCGAREVSDSTRMRSNFDCGWATVTTAKGHVKQLCPKCADAFVKNEPLWLRRTRSSAGTLQALKTILRAGNS